LFNLIRTGVGDTGTGEKKKRLALRHYPIPNPIHIGKREPKISQRQPAGIF
jgi:hypothetical protein